MLDDVWPLFALRIETPRLVLRLPRDEEIARLAEVAADGVHEPGERPFLTPWTEGSAQDRARDVLQGHWGQLGSWETAAWRLGLGVFRGDEPLGVITLRARDFAVVREVSTSSWLGLPHHRQGFGTEAREGALCLAFEHLGAEFATSEAFPDNAASMGVSCRLGYEPDGVSRDRRDDEVLVSHRLRLGRDRWAEREHPPIHVSGIEGCRAMFG